jgi:FkbM family methyltransferase
MIILYGIENHYVDITKKVFIYNYIFHDKNLNKIYISGNDKYRSIIFGDQGMKDIVKHIIINNKKYENDINLPVYIKNKKDLIKSFTPYEKLEMIHNNTLFNGDIKNEFDEQLMAATFIKEESIVLEIGANIGRNTNTIARLLKDSRNLVSLETRKDLCDILRMNRDNNNLNFIIENSALSLNFMIQHKNSWDAIPVSSYEEIKGIEDFFIINTISFDYLEKRYLENKHFDTIVADCEGSLYYIFQDFPNILEHIDTIIMENDYRNISHKKYVDEFLLTNGFICIYRKSGGWEPCYNCFYETWIKL